MPTVPEYQRQIVQSQMPDIRMPQTDVRKLNFDNLSQAQQGFANALENASTSLYNQQVKTALQQNMIAIQQAKTDYLTKLNDAAYDPTSGILNTQGTNALGVTKKMQDVSNSTADDIIQNSGLINDNSMRKQAFLQEIAPLQESYQRMAETHEYKQTQIAAKETADASANASQNAVILNYDKTQAALDPKTGQPLLDENGNQQQVYLSDAPFQSGMQDRINYDKSIGMPQEAIAQDVQAFASDTITKGVKAALANHDFAGATAFLQRYGNDPTKMNKETYNTLQQSIEKQYAPVRAQQIADNVIAQYGTNITAVNAALKQFENDPYYSIIRSAVKANLSDATAAKNQQDKDRMKYIANQIYGINNMQQAVAVINKLQADGVIDASQADTLLSRTRGKISAMNYTGPKTPASKEATWAASYETGGQLVGDQDVLEHYQEVLNDPDQTVSPSLQKQADMASYRMNRYWTTSSGGTYDAEQADAVHEQSQQALQGLYDSIEVLAEKGFTKDQIMQRAQPALDALGIDADQFDSTVDWNKLGKRPGGVK